MDHTPTWILVSLNHLLPVSWSLQGLLVFPMPMQEAFQMSSPLSYPPSFLSPSSGMRLHTSSQSCPPYSSRPSQTVSFPRTCWSPPPHLLLAGDPELRQALAADWGGRRKEGPPVQALWGALQVVSSFEWAPEASDAGGEPCWQGL